MTIPRPRPRSRAHADADARELKSTADPRRLSSVAAALRLLKEFSADEPEFGITALAKRMGLAKSTVHRLAKTLVSEGFLAQNQSDERYRLGLTLFALGTLVRLRMDVSRQALPHLDILREQTNETVHLAVLEHSDIMYLYNLESAQAIRTRSYLGMRKPAFCTSEGRAILAFSPQPLISRVLHGPLQARTPKTTVAVPTLLKLLAMVRDKGYALDDEESEVGMRGISAPIRDASGQVVAAVGIAGPVQRLSKSSLRTFIPLAIQAAQNISTRLGHSSP